MPKQLEALSAVWTGLDKRMQQTNAKMYPLITQFYNPQSGSFRRLMDMYAMLGQRLQTLGAADASAPEAADDDEVKTLLAEIAQVKVTCQRLSKEFWALKPQVNRIIDELEDLNKALRKVVKEKSKLFTVSSSVAELRKLSDLVNDVYVDFTGVVGDNRLLKPDDPLIA